MTITCTYCGAEFTGMTGKENACPQCLRALMTRHSRLYYRVCETCHKGMNEGYIYNDGCFCSLACAGLTEAEWDEIYDEEGDNYWTEWDGDPSPEAEAYNRLAAAVYSINPHVLDDDAITQAVQHILDAAGE